MPKREDIKNILIIGSGPITIGQGCEFDYSGTQACLALREEGFRVTLINPNVATIMTDIDIADATYIEPICTDVIEEIIKKEYINAILATMGGQTALNCAVKLKEEGILSKYNVELIGAKYESIQMAEDREKFTEVLTKIGLNFPKSFTAQNLDKAISIFANISLPAIIRPSFTLGGFLSGTAYNREEYIEICKKAFATQNIHKIQIDESIYGWKEYELEVMRDRNDNSIIVCSIENLDPVGIHTGDSITVAPAQTLTDKEYQNMRNAALKIMRAIGVDTGGANVQFAINPTTGEMMVIEMNPRVSRSSALASKATGYPIAKLAAKLAVGFHLNELINDMTSTVIPASFEPTLDYVVVKMPFFDLDKFPQVSNRLGLQMKSIGEAMAIGRTFQEALQKVLTSLEKDLIGLDSSTIKDEDLHDKKTDELLAIPTPERIFHVAKVLKNGYTIDHIHNLTKIDPWFLYQIKELMDIENELVKLTINDIDESKLRELKYRGFSDANLAKLVKVDEKKIRSLRKEFGCLPIYNRIDTVAAEFSTSSDYIYSTYELFKGSCLRKDNQKRDKSIIIIGSGPNRIGQGIEFDYCCVLAVKALRKANIEAVMINCNPETVSTDYNISDRLYFEPLTYEKVLDIIEHENPFGVIVQFGGQTPLNLVKKLSKAHVKILGTNYQTIKSTEDRSEFRDILAELNLCQPPNGIGHNIAETLEVASRLTYPLIIRPSFVLGGKAMKIIDTPWELDKYLKLVEISYPLLIEEFIEDAIEVDVDAVCDPQDIHICGVLEHIERAGVHSGDSASCTPPFSLPPDIVKKIVSQTKIICLKIGVIGLINAQFAIKNGKVYVIEVNPRASRTIPFITKAFSIPCVDLAINVILGTSIIDQNIVVSDHRRNFAVKEAIFSFNKLEGSSPLLGPVMKSTGEVMGVGYDFLSAFRKAQRAAGFYRPTKFQNKYLLILSLDIGSHQQQEIFDMINLHKLKALIHEKYQNISDKYQHANVRYFADTNISEIEEIISRNEIMFIINIQSKAASYIHPLLELGIRSNLLYTTTLHSLKIILESVTRPHAPTITSLQET